MRYRKIAAISFFLLLSFPFICFAGAAGFTLDSGAFNSVPEPRLRYPINESAVLTRDEPLEFKWWNDVTGIQGFVLKIYKGYDMYGANLIYKKDLPADSSSLEGDQGLFEDGQVYTWSLVRVSFAGYKSDRSFNSFKVIKE
ncbi:MAG: hypothetical protein PHW98_05980 [Candidatus Omnitrophica bacterium]|nr:hypothetical protein [Candidatus Omnitrophota bacterium]MDD5771585.1 hypothetical protein [Candidatus Omnitrophota bacterium]